MLLGGGGIDAYTLDSPTPRIALRFLTPKQGGVRSSLRLSETLPCGQATSDRLYECSTCGMSSLRLSETEPLRPNLPPPFSSWPKVQATTNSSNELTVAAVVQRSTTCNNDKTCELQLTQLWAKASVQKVPRPSNPDTGGILKGLGAPKPFSPTLKPRTANGMDALLKGRACTCMLRGLKHFVPCVLPHAGHGLQWHPPNGNGTVIPPLQYNICLLKK